jgi:hypothetical protein
VVGAPDIDHVQVAVEFEDGHQHGGAASSTNAMAREPMGRFEALAQASDALIDSFRCAHISVPTRRK